HIAGYNVLLRPIRTKASTKRPTTPKNNKQETQNKIVYITQNHTTNTHKTKRFTHACYKDAHAHYATTNHHTNTTTRKQTNRPAH
ncbi:hypothetical protein ACRQGC_09115, partial [Actinotignum sp. GS-2025c]|uniref:hypothetical protein n=1 Tax=Actinotignum sp. GS-2025c TaxID=3427276 RepID=UPI003F475C5B